MKPQRRQFNFEISDEILIVKMLANAGPPYIFKAQANLSFPNLSSTTKPQ